MKKLLLILALVLTGCENLAEIDSLISLCQKSGGQAQIITNNQEVIMRTGRVHEVNCIYSLTQQYEN